MASVQYKKLKSPQEVKAMFRHCDGDKRISTNHSNIDIDKSATPGNMQGNLGYYAACLKYDDKIARLDAKSGANKRSDRVLAFGLNTPAPKDLKPEDEEAFFLEVVNLIAEQYGADNIIQYYMHQDEKHEYINAETGEMCMSRAHLQCYVIPEHNGKLNGKWFSSRRNMNKLNNSVHRMSLKKFGVKFMDGSKKKSRKTVEQLKNESTYLEAQRELERQKDALDVRQAAVYVQETALDIKAGELQFEEENLLKLKNTLSEKETELNNREIDLKAHEDDYKKELHKAVEVKNMASKVLQRLQDLEEEDRQLIELGKKQRRNQQLSVLEADPVIQAYHKLNDRLGLITPQV